MKHPKRGRAEASGSQNLALAIHRDREGAVEKMVDEFQLPLYNYALRLLGNSFDAQEVAQDALLRAYRALAFQYDEQKSRRISIKPWLFRITRNLIYDRLRSRRRLQRNEIASGDGFDPYPAQEEVPEEVILRQEERESLGQVLERLRPGIREVMLLRFMEEMSYAEIAATVGINESTARGRVFRGLEKLRLELGGDGNYEL